MTVPPERSPDVGGGGDRRPESGPDSVGGGGPTMRDAIGLAFFAARWMLLASSWLVVAAVAAVTVQRVVAWDTAVSVLVWADAVGWLVAIPVLPVAIGGAVARRWWLVGAASALVVAQVALTVPELAAGTSLPSWAVGAPTVRLVDANLDKASTVRPAYLRAIRRERPDLLAFEEFTPAAGAFAGRLGYGRIYPYVCAAPAFGVSGFALASRWPLTGCHMVTVPGEALSGGRITAFAAATVDTPYGALPVRVVHPVAPLPGSAGTWHAALVALGRSVRQAGARRMLVVGDFNATWGSAGFRALLGDGLVDAAAARGHPFDATWPNGAIVPPFLRIDHVLTGTGLAVTTIASHAGDGSDHRFLTATVAIRR
jgi:endonuclease/exonuclease/phosphatase (EEP) superfamily protein YafD